MKIGMLTDFPAVEYCNGLHSNEPGVPEKYGGRGHTVKFIGPKPHKGQREVEGDGNILFSSCRLRLYKHSFRPPMAPQGVPDDRTWM